MNILEKLKYNLDKTVFIQKSRRAVGNCEAPYISSIVNSKGVSVSAVAGSDLGDWDAFMYEPLHDRLVRPYGDVIGRGNIEFNGKGVGVFATYTKQSVKLFKYIDLYEAGWSSLFVKYEDMDVIHDFAMEQRELTGKDTLMICFPTFINVCGECGSCVLRVGGYGVWEAYSLPEFLKSLSREHDVNLFRYSTIKFVHGAEMYSNGKAVKCMGKAYVITLKLSHSAEANRYYAKTLCLM